MVMLGSGTTLGGAMCDDDVVSGGNFHGEALAFAHICIDGKTAIVEAIAEVLIKSLLFIGKL